MPVPTSNNSENPDMVVRIGIREIYDSVQGLVQNVGILSRQIETLNTSLSSNTSETGELERRVRSLETQKVVTPASMWAAIGVLATVAGVIITLINMQSG
jgi:hypothetical protein